VTIVFEVDDNINYIKLHIDNAYRLIKIIIMMLIINRDINEKR